LNREETQLFLQEKAAHIDLIVPRGGKRLIEFFNSNAKCPVLVSGRGNNESTTESHNIGKRPFWRYFHYSQLPGAQASPRFEK
jgi:hypothetical protein